MVHSPNKEGYCITPFPTNLRLQPLSHSKKKGISMKFNELLYLYSSNCLQNHDTFFLLLQ